MTTNAVPPAAAAPQPGEIAPVEHKFAPRFVSSQVLTELKSVRNHERTIKNFGRFLVSFGAAVAVVGAIVAIAAFIVSSPVGWAVGAAVVVLGVTFGITGIIMHVMQSRGKPISQLQSIKNGFTAALSWVSSALAWNVNTDNLKKGHEEGTPSAKNVESWLMSLLLFEERRGTPGKLSWSRNKEEYNFIENKVSLFAFDVPLQDLNDETQKSEYENFLQERAKAGEQIIGNEPKPYDTVVVPLVKSGKISDACDALWFLYNKEEKGTKPKRERAIEIAALMLRARKKPVSKDYYDAHLEKTKFMVLREIGENPDNPDPRLLIAYNQLCKKSPT